MVDEFLVLGFDFEFEFEFENFLEVDMWEICEVVWSLDELGGSFLVSWCKGCVFEYKD